MNLLILAPAALALAVGVMASASHRKWDPVVSARVHASMLGLSLTAIVPTTASLGLGYLAQRPMLAGPLSWCRDALRLDDTIPWWIGVPALLVMAVGSIRLVRVARRFRRYRWNRSSAGPQIVPSADVFAYTLPGAGRQIVLSSALAGMLNREELSIVIAHEEAHARHRHDLFLLLGATAVAWFPALAVLNRRMLFAIERWADESAAGEAPARRDQVAMTLATVALAGSAAPQSVLGMAALGVVDRVEALLRPPKTDRSVARLLVIGLGIAVVAAAGLVQLHHVWTIATSLCLR